MKPIGLTLKNLKTNPFTGRTSGEPMLVHLCLTCGRISCNRIAGDDLPDTLIALLDGTETLDNETMNRLAGLGIRLLSEADKSIMLSALYGYAYLEQIGRSESDFKDEVSYYKSYHSHRQKDKVTHLSRIWAIFFSFDIKPEMV